MTFTYNSNVPAANDPPKNDQPTMQSNAASIASIIAVDHIGFNIPNGGYHKVIHQPPQGADPTAIPGIGQTYTKTLSGDQQLFFESGGGVITQLTGPNTAIAAGNGYTWIPGGILLQWGSITGGLTSGTNTDLFFATANINFPNNCFNVNATLINAGSTNNEQTISIRDGSVSNLGFKWNYSGGGAYSGFFWFAIGN
jgi:hypothetical protein